MATMLDYINEEEASLKQIMANYQPVAEPNLAQLTTLLILATGSSYNACLAAKATMEKIANISITIEEPYNFNHYGTLPNSVDAVLAVSQSGKSASTIDAMARIKEKGKLTIALTSNLESPLSKMVDHLVDIDMGGETVGFVTKGYSATVLQLILLSVTIGYSKGIVSATSSDFYQGELNKVISNFPEIIEKSNQFFEHYEALFKVANRYIAIGYGPNWGTAKEFETKFTETVRRPSQGFELEAYMHGPYLEANHEHVLFFIETPSINLGRSKQLRDYMRPYVGKTLTITTEKSNDEDTLGLDLTCDEFVSQLALVIPFQLLAYKIATAKGIDLSERIFDDFDRVLKSKI